MVLSRRLWSELWISAVAAAQEKEGLPLGGGSEDGREEHRARLEVGLLGDDNYIWALRRVMT